MARKRLSDLLREEANKPEDAPAATDEQSPASTRRRRTRSTEATQSSEATQSTESPAPPDASDTPDTTALDTAVADLKTALEKAQQIEADLQQQVADLQTELETEKARTTRLEADLKRMTSLKTELEQAKATALQLADANTKLTEDLKTAKAASKPSSNPPSPPPNPPTTASPTAQRKDAMLQQQRHALAHPMFPTDNLPSQGPDTDMGWVD